MNLGQNFDVARELPESGKWSLECRVNSDHMYPLGEGVSLGTYEEGDDRGVKLQYGDTSLLLSESDDQFQTQQFTKLVGAARVQVIYGFRTSLQREWELSVATPALTLELYVTDGELLNISSDRPFSRKDAAHLIKFLFS